MDPTPPSAAAVDSAPIAPPAPVATPITTAAPAAAPEELVYSTVLNKDDMHLLEMGGERAIFTPHDIRQYIADYYNPPRGGIRNHKYKKFVDPDEVPITPVTKKDFKELEFFDECRELLSRHPLYMRKSREAQQKILFRFVKYCSMQLDNATAGITSFKRRAELGLNCKVYLDEFMVRYSQKGSILL